MTEEDDEFGEMDYYEDVCEGLGIKIMTPEEYFLL